MSDVSNEYVRKSQKSIATEDMPVKKKNQNPMSPRILCHVRTIQPSNEGAGWVKEAVPLLLSLVASFELPEDRSSALEFGEVFIGFRPSTSSAYACSKSRCRLESDL